MSENRALQPRENFVYVRPEEVNEPEGSNPWLSRQVFVLFSHMNQLMREREELRRMEQWTIVSSAQQTFEELRNDLRTLSLAIGTEKSERGKLEFQLATLQNSYTDLSNENERLRLQITKLQKSSKEQEETVAHEHYRGTKEFTNQVAKLQQEMHNWAEELQSNVLAEVTKLRQTVEDYKKTAPKEVSTSKVKWSNPTFVAEEVGYESDDSSVKREMPVFALAPQGLPKAVKLTPPAKFTGENSKRNPQAWLAQLQLYFSAVGVVSDAQKITVALSLLDGPAATWGTLDPLMQATLLAGSWTQFTQKLVGQFQPVDAGTLAKDKLKKLKYEAGSDWSVFVQEIRTLLLSLPHSNDEQKVDILECSVPTDVQSFIRMHHGPTTSFDELCGTLSKQYSILQSTRFSGGMLPSFGRKQEKVNNGQSSSLGGVSTHSGSYHKKQWCHFCKSSTHSTHKCHRKQEFEKYKAKLAAESKEGKK